MSEVVHLLDRAPVPCGGVAGLCEWLRSWVDGIESGEFGDIRAMVLVLETPEGKMATIAQSTTPMTRARMAGLLTCAAHDKMGGAANIESLRK